MKKQVTNSPSLPRDVLIVEDSATQATVFKIALEKQGWRVRVAGDGVAAMEQARLRKPDIVVSDIRMPEMDGYALSKAIKTDPALHDVPVVLLTSLSQSRDIIDAINSRADYYFLKQWNHDILIAKIASVLDSYQPFPEPGRGGLTLRCDGQTYMIEANAQQPLHLLLSTYEIAVQQSMELVAARDTLREANESLEETVRARTAQFIASETRYRRLFEAAKDGILILDAETGMVVDVNPFLGEMLGCSREEFLDQKIWDLVAFKNVIANQDQFIELQQISTEYVRYEEAVLESRAGKRHEVEFVSNAYLVNNHKVIQCNIRDISALKREAEEASRMVTVVRDSNDAITIQDFEGRITAWNHGAELMYGYSEAEALAMNIERLTAPGKVAEQKNSVRRLVASEAITSLETQRVTKDGRVLDVWMTVTKLVNKAGKPIGIASTERDITARKKAEEGLLRLNAELEQRVEERTHELVHTKEAAEAANRAKSDFLASMSHELRTPLGAIIGFSELLEEKLFGGLTPKQEQHVKHILESGRHLLSLINDILDLSKVEAGKMELEPSSVPIATLLEDSLVMVKEKCMKHGIALALDLPDPIKDLVISADERKLKQIMYNLLSNAAKFTPQGGQIRVQARVVGQQSLGAEEKFKAQCPMTIDNRNPDVVEVSVSDTGCGIAKEHQEKIYEAFYQVADAAKGKTPGTGLGLPLTRRLVEMHGGRIWLESAGAGKGSTFRFAIPIRCAAGV